MNYYNPYLYNIPASSPGLIKSIFGSGASFGTFLTNAQKIITTINQTLPVIRQVTPVIKNAKTMFSVMNEFKKVETPVKNNTVQTVQTKSQQITEEKNKTIAKQQNFEIKNKLITSGPNFFI